LFRQGHALEWADLLREHRLRDAWRWTPIAARTQECKFTWTEAHSPLNNAWPNLTAAHRDKFIAFILLTALLEPEHGTFYDGARSKGSRTSCRRFVSMIESRFRSSQHNTPGETSCTHVGN